MDNEKKSGGEQVVWIAIAVMIALVAVAWALKKPVSVMATYSAYAMYRLLHALSVARDYQVDLMYQLGARIELGHFEMSWPSIIELVNDSWRYPAVLAGGIIALFGVGLLMIDPLKRYIRRLGMDELLYQQALVFPEMRPVVGLGKQLLDRRKFDEGPWRLAEMPIQFALKHGLLIDKEKNEPVKATSHEEIDFRYAREHYVLDEKKAQAVLESQLGPCLYENGTANVRAILSWPRAHRALLAAFILARWHGRDQAFALLAQFSNSFWEPDRKKKRPIDAKNLDMTWVNELLKAWCLGKPLPKACPWPGPSSKKVVEEIVHEISRHAFANPIMFHMLEKARDRGIVVVSDFIWLRPVDRTLYYTLNNAGRHNQKNATGFVEGIGPVAHWQVEEACGRALVVPDVREAVEGLESALYEEGWVCRSRRNDSISSKKQAEQAIQKRTR